MNDARLQAWVRWKELCSLSKCSDAERGLLQAWIGRRFNHYLDESDPDLPTHESAYAAEVFEDNATQRGLRGGKRYKDWIFEQAGDDPAAALRCIEGRATVRVRDLVREVMSHHRRVRRDTRPLDAPVSDELGSPTLGDLLGDALTPATVAWTNELRAIARAMAQTLFREMDERERGVTRARSAGISFTDPELETAVGIKKTTIYETFAGLRERIARRLAREYDGEDRDSLAVLLELVLLELNEAAQN